MSEGWEGHEPNRRASIPKYVWFRGPPGNDIEVKAISSLEYLGLGPDASRTLPQAVLTVLPVENKYLPNLVNSLASVFVFKCILFVLDYLL